MIFRRRTLPRSLLAILAVVAGLLLLGIGFTRGRPSLVEASPADGSRGVPSFTPIRLTFTRSMHRLSVEGNLVITPALAGNYTWEDDRTVVFTPETLWPGGVDVTVELPTSAQSSLRLPLANPRSWTFSVADTLLAYLWPADGLADIYALDLDSGKTVRLTETARGILDFFVSTDGGSIFYSTPNALGGTALYRFDRLKNETVVMLDCGQEVCNAPQLSPDGRYLAYASDSIWLMFGLDSEPIELGGAFSPVWSPSGLLTYFDPLDQGYIFYNPENSSVIRFPNETGEPGAWAPDGKTFTAPEILLPDDQEGMPVSHLLQFNLATRLTTDLSRETNVEDSTPAFAPAGNLITFGRKYLDAARWTPGRQLWIMSPDGENTRQLTDDPAYNHTAFTWHPDGTHIAYIRSNVADLTEPPEIWFVNADGSEPFRVVVGGFSPVWIP